MKKVDQICGAILGAAVADAALLAAVAVAFSVGVGTARARRAPEYEATSPTAKAAEMPPRG